MSSVRVRLPAYVVIWLKLGFRVDDLLAGVNADLLGRTNHFLPKAGGIGQERTASKDSHSLLSPSLLTVLSDRTAEKTTKPADMN